MIKSHGICFLEESPYHLQGCQSMERIIRGHSLCASTYQLPTRDIKSSLVVSSGFCPTRFHSTVLFMLTVHSPVSSQVLLALLGSE